MSFPIIRAAAKVERSDEHHLARLLILLRAAEQKKRTALTRSIAGIMKLAKLDFLLRYPNCLERTLKHFHIEAKEAKIQPFERDSIEAKMIRFRYGPWDERYRRWIGLLVSKGMAVTFLDGRTVHVGLTDEGRKIAETLGGLDEFVDLGVRSRLVVEAVGGMSATQLKNFVYEVFPEILTMEWGEEIRI